MKSQQRSDNPLNFLKIILSDNTPSTRIMLPEKFTKVYGKFLSETVTLKVPNGDVWKVDLHKSGDKIWLKNGWGKFAEKYGLKFGSLLMFKYEGLSRFSVVIFDASASEIEYPKSTDPVKVDARKGPVTCDEFKTVIKEEDMCSSWSGDEEQRVKIYDEGECSRKRKGMDRNVEGRRALEKAKSNLKSDKPFFIAPMGASYVAKSGVYIPTKFRRKLLSREYLLQLTNDVKEKTWKAVANDEHFLWTGGWMKFVKDNGIKFGDVCVLSCFKIAWTKLFLVSPSLDLLLKLSVVFCYGNARTGHLFGWLF